jgi:pilus assembly protein CpaE
LEVIASEGLEKLFNILRTLYDWIIVDLSHWPDEVYRRIIQDVGQVLLLTELTVPDMRNLNRMKLIFQGWGVEPEKVKVVVNRYMKSNSLSLAEVERVTGQSVYCTLPSDYFGLMEAMNLGVPLAVAAPKSKLCRALQRLARQMVEEVQPPDSKDKRRKGAGWLRLLSF